MSFLISTDSAPILHLKKNDKLLAGVIEKIGDIEGYEHTDPFSFIAGEIIEQMLSVKVAECIRRRIRELCGGEFTPQSLASKSPEQLRNAGLSRNKAEYLLNFASAVLSDSLNLDVLATLPDEEIISRLTALRGIGSWTAKMYLLFVLKRDDVLPYEDGAFMATFKWLYNMPKPKKEEVISKCLKWKPYSSFAARYLYRAHDLRMTDFPAP